ncbi:MAG: FtsX-like permease family protein [Ruminococcaceae bacterium]|nr:FtsX-like permease family protein [Oscillospiraceae bacterium]
MSIFNKVTIKSLKKNRVRTIVTIIGIVLSAAMICAVTTFASSIYNYALDNAKYIDGDWHGSAEDTDYKTYKFIKEDNKISNHVYAQHVGYALLENCINEYKPYLFVLGAGEGFKDMMPVHITAGKYPSSSDEILIPKHLYENGNVNFSLGEKIKLSLGQRSLDGYYMGQNNPCYVYNENNEAVPNGEKFEELFEKEYTVVGFYERPTFESYSAPGYTAITVADGSGNSEFYSVWFKMKNPKDVYNYIHENPFSGSTNSSVLRYSGVSRYEGYNAMITSLATIVIILIMIGSISLIYNAFSISVSQRTQQFGLLSSVGATKKQLKKMVLFEALTVSAVGIPLGIMSGIGGIGVTLIFVGNKFKSILGYPIPLKLNVSVVSVVIAIMVSLVTVLISAYIPSKRATKVTAIEAIRQSKDVSVKSERIRTPKLVYKLFGLSGMLANKYYKRSKKKYRATVVSLFMSVVLFVSASAFTGTLTESVDESIGNVNYDILVIGHEDEFINFSVYDLLDEIKNIGEINGVACAKTDTFLARIDADLITNDFLEYYKQSEVLNDEKIEFASVYTNLRFIDDYSFKALLSKYKLNENDYYNKDNPLAIAVEGASLFDATVGKYVSCKVLKSDESSLTISFPKNIDGYYYAGNTENEKGESLYEYKKSDNPEEVLYLTEEEAYKRVKNNIGKIIYEAPFYVEANSRVVLLYPLSMREYVLPSDNPNDSSYAYFITTDNHNETVKRLEEVTSKLGLLNLRIRDAAADREEENNIVTIISVFAYGFIVLISLIAAANVFNTISTNIALRRREFAMLKSVGMTAKGFNLMMNYECLLYGTRALLFGIPVSIGVSYLIYLSISQGYINEYKLPLGAIAIAVLSVFIVVFVTMMYSMSRIKKENPIDALKSENL